MEFTDKTRKDKEMNMSSFQKTTYSIISQTDTISCTNPHLNVESLRFSVASGAPYLAFCVDIFSQLVPPDRITGIVYVVRLWRCLVLQIFSSVVQAARCFCQVWGRLRRRLSEVRQKRNTATQKSDLKFAYETN